MKPSGIYCIENIVTGKKYIGQSIDLNRRRKNHRDKLKNGVHRNSHLQNSYNKYGETSFEFKILIFCEPFELTKYEQFFVDSYTPEKLYNICLESMNSRAGVLASKETKEKISKTRIENGKSKGERNSMYGKTHTAEARKKISDANKGRIRSQELKDRVSLKLSGANSPVAKLTEEEVIEIKKLLKEGTLFQGEIAKIYNINRRTINYINTGKIWKHLSDE